MIRRFTVLTALSALMIGIAGCGDDGPTQPQYQGTDMIVAWVRDSLNNAVADRIIAIDVLISSQPKFILDSARLHSSPRQGKIVFLTEKVLQNTSAIYVADVDGKNLRKIDSSGVFERSLSYPVLARDGSKVVYATLDKRLILHTLSNNEQKVLHNNAAFETIPDFSPDNSRIAFHANDDKLYIINVDGSGLRSVADNPDIAPEGDARVEWSPDGKKLLYVGRSTAGQLDIYVVNVDGGGTVQLTNDGEGDYHPTWSPDGSRIAWSGFPGDIYVMNADGSGRQNLTPNTANSNFFPDWSPDGSKIIFTNRFSSQDAGTLRRYDFSTSQSEVLVSNAYRGFWGRF